MPKRLALERALEIIGEAASHVPQDYRAQHIEIRWSSMVGLRNILAHGYSVIEGERLWLSAQEDIPELLKLLNDLLPPDV